jgi:hypothetical protein
MQKKYRSGMRVGVFLLLFIFLSSCSQRESARGLASLRPLSLVDLDSESRAAYEGIIDEARVRLGKHLLLGHGIPSLQAALDDLSRGTWTVTVPPPLYGRIKLYRKDSYGVLEVLRSQGRFFGAFGSWVTGQLAFSEENVQVTVWIGDLAMEEKLDLLVYDESSPEIVEVLKIARDGSVDISRYEHRPGWMEYPLPSP